MNWYKKSQLEVEEDIGNYFDVGHLGENKNILWISDKSGGNFKTQEVNAGTRVHSNAFGYGSQNEQSIWGRYDPDRNIVSIALPKDHNIQGQSLDTKDLPNRLIKRLMSEFPGASIYGYGFGDAIRII